MAFISILSLLWLQIVGATTDIDAFVQIRSLGEDLLEVRSPRRLHRGGRRLLETKPESIFSIEDCGSMAGLSEAKKTLLANGLITKCISVFGALVAGENPARNAWLVRRPLIPGRLGDDDPWEAMAGENERATAPGHLEATDCNLEDYMLAAANVLAQMLDTQLQGKVSDPNVLDYIKTFNGTASTSFVLCGCSQYQEEIHDIEKWVIPTQAWRVAGLGDKDVFTVLTEEVFHMVHQSAWQYVYPVFEATWESNLGMCVKQAQCVWYMHPENAGCSDSTGTKCTNDEVSCSDGCESFNVPGQCYESGHTCAGPECDLVEFFHKVYLVYYEASDVYLYGMMIDGGAHTKVGLVEKMESSAACTQLLADMQNTDYSLPREILVTDYTITAAPTPAPTPATTPSPPVAPTTAPQEVSNAWRRSNYISFLGPACFLLLFSFLA